MTTGPNRMANEIQDRLDDIAARLGGDELCRKERKHLNKRAHELGALLQWCKSRAGYVGT